MDEVRSANAELGVSRCGRNGGEEEKLVFRAAGGAEEDFFEVHGGFALAEARRDFGERAIGDFLAALEDEDVRADFLEQVEQMGAEDDRRSVARALEDGVFHPADAEGIEAGERLVEEHDLRGVEQAARDRELLFHAAGELAGKLVGFVGDLELLKKRLRERFVVADAVDAGDEIEVLTDGEIIEEPGFVGEERERALGGQRGGGEVVTGDAEGAGAGGNDAGEAAERGGFAGAVGADEAEDFAWANEEGQLADGSEAAVAFGEGLDLDHDWAREAGRRKQYPQASSRENLSNCFRIGPSSPRSGNCRTALRTLPSVSHESS